MTQKNIVLIGFMGTGKSLVSNDLGSRWGRKVYSTDQIIEQNESMSIPEIFDSFGEEKFRQLEAKVVEDIAYLKGVIIDCGGGIVLNESNVVKLKENGILIFLESNAQQIYDIVKEDSNRPLLRVDDPLLKITELLEQRTPLYEKAADFKVVSGGKNIKEVADLVKKVVEDVE